MPARCLKFLSVAVLIAISTSLACRRKSASEPPVAKVSVAFNHPKAALGSPVEITYRFDVDAAAPPFKESYTAFVHFLNADGELMWTDDHVPPTPTTEWKPGQTVEYTRTLFIPIYPYIGDAAVHVGLYSSSSQKRLPLSGQDTGQREYKVATLQVLPQSENLFVVRKDGWHGPESPTNNPQAEWQWTKANQSTLTFRNPKKDAVFYFDVDNPSRTFPQGQQVQVKVGDAVVATFVVEPEHQVLQKIPLTAAQLGAADMVELKIVTDKTFVPALVPGSTNGDRRELGVRVFHAFVEPKN